MEISRKAWLVFVKKLRAIDEKAADQMLKYINTYGMQDQQKLIDYAYAIATKYGEASAALSAEMYDFIAEKSGVYLPAAEAAETATYSEVARTVMGTLKTGNEVIISNAVSSLVKKAGADTTLKNAIRDKAQFAWIPNGDTCSFCLTLASRGWQNASAKALNGGHAEHIHANCDCAYAVRFKPDTKFKGYEPEKYLEMYREADGKTSAEKINSMRRQHYAEHKDEINAQKRAAYAARKAREDEGQSGS